MKRPDSVRVIHEARLLHDNERQALLSTGKRPNTTKSRARAKAEHNIGVIKRVFGFSRLRHRGLAENAHCLFAAPALANLFMCHDDW